jgi:hypothetical protein
MYRATACSARLRVSWRAATRSARVPVVVATTVDLLCSGVYDTLIMELAATASACRAANFMINLPVGIGDYATSRLTLVVSAMVANAAA